MDQSIAFALLSKCVYTWATHISAVSYDFILQANSETISDDDCKYRRYNKAMLLINSSLLYIGM